MFSWFRKAPTKVKALEPAAPNQAEQAKQVFREGFAKFQSGQHHDAGVLFERALAIEPNHSDALYLSGVLAQSAGDVQKAMVCFHRAIASDPAVPSFHYSLAQLHGMQGARQAAIECYRAAIALDPDDVDTRAGIGLELYNSGLFNESLENWRAAERLQPGNAQIHFNLAVVMQAAGKSSDAVESYRRTLELDRDHPQAHNNLGALLHGLGEWNAAANHFRAAVAKEPTYSQAWGNLGVTLLAVGKVDEAGTCLQRAVELDNKDFGTFSNLALVQRQQGLLEKSNDSSERALTVRNSTPERIRKATLLPVIAQSSDDIIRWRKNFAAEVDVLMAHPGFVEDPLREVGTCNFNLAYQQECNRELQEKIANLHLACAPLLHYTAPHCVTRVRASDRRIRVGFISKFMYEHSIGKTTRGLVAHIDREKFQVAALFIPPFVDDQVSRFIKDHADQHVVLSGNLQEAYEQIAKLELDVLFYQDIGMDAQSYYLAFARLAPVQCVSFGHPDTTGIPNMDYWVSSENFELPRAEKHYSEELFLLRDLGTLAYYYKPVLTQPVKQRSHFGIGDEKNIYICPQSLFKLHPDFDFIIAGILRGDEDGELILIEEGRTKVWGELLRKRFETTLPDVSRRIRFLQGLKHADFLNLLAVSDVMLDTIYFNGMNSSLEGLAVGTPIVTMPTHMQRGRHTFGMYKRMGVFDCIAESPQDYINLALRLGRDKDLRDLVSRKISNANSVLYEDINVAREFGRFFEFCYQKSLNAEAEHRTANTSSSSKYATGRGGEFLFLVTSAIHTPHGAFSAEERLTQTEATCRSIVERCPQADIVIIEGGVRPLTKEEITRLRKYAVEIKEFGNSPEGSKILTISSQDRLKSQMEIFMFHQLLLDLTADANNLIGRYQRIFKVSGRYCLNDEFDINVHKAAVGQVVLVEARASQFDLEMTGGIAHQYMSRLWSFDASLLSKMVALYHQMSMHVGTYEAADHYVDVEHLLYRYLDPGDVQTVKRIGIQGNVAPSGRLISD